GTAAWTLAATDPRGGTRGWNSSPTLARALALEITPLPPRWWGTEAAGAGGTPRGDGGGGGAEQGGLCRGGRSPRGRRCARREGSQRLANVEPPPLLNGGDVGLLDGKRGLITGGLN